MNENGGCDEISSAAGANPVPFYILCVPSMNQFGKVWFGEPMTSFDHYGLQNVGLCDTFISGVELPWLGYT